MLKKHKIVKLQEHLYILNENATIVEGDWYIYYNNPNSLEVRQDKNDVHGMCSCDKIIATTDKFLNCKQIESCSKSLNNKCICPNKLPQIPISFLQEYIKSPVDEVEVEYENKYIGKCIPDEKGCHCYDKNVLKLTPKNEIIISPIEISSTVSLFKIIEECESKIHTKFGFSIDTQKIFEPLYRIQLEYNIYVKENIK